MQDTARGQKPYLPKTLIRFERILQRAMRGEETSRDGVLGRRFQGGLYRRPAGRSRPAWCAVFCTGCGSCTDQLPNLL